MRQNWQRAIQLLFPERKNYTHPLPAKMLIPIFIGLVAVFSLAGLVLKPGGFIGFDWIHFFGIRNVPPFYPPWTVSVVQVLTWPLLVGITLAAFSVAVYLRSVHPISLAAAFFSVPFLWTVFLGQLDGISLLGLLGLPWLVPLVLVKPQVSIFALGARWQYLAAFLIFLMISLLVWGNWPARTLAVETFYAEGRYPQNIGLGLYGLPLFLLTVWFSRGDLDMLMASGSFITPHLIPYNLLPLSPAIARLRPRAALAATFFSWLTFSANWLGPKGWWLGWIFVIWLWLNLAATRYPHWRMSRWICILAG